MENRQQDPRRGSIGIIDVGDTQGSALSTSHSGELRSRARKASLSSKNKDAKAPKIPHGAHHEPAKEIKGVKRTWLQVQEFLYSYSWFLPLSVSGVVYAAWYFIGGSWLDACVRVSYPVPGTDPKLYAKGRADIAFTCFYAVVFTFIREFTMQTVLKPLARYFDITSRHKVNRFLEQTYSMLYYGVSGPVGLWIMYNSDLWYFNTRAFYENFPHKADTLPFKTFYLLQAAFWLQQAFVLVLNLEKRRKDFKELVFHHVVTLALIILSYRFHFTHIGLCVYITMDVSDFWLALSKTLNYLDNWLTPIVFIIFVAVWTYLRHYINLVFLWSIATEFRTVGPFELNWDTQQYKCWLSQYITFALMLALQLVNFYWLILIIRILYRYLFLNVQKDVRSDDESD